MSQDLPPSDAPRRLLMLTPAFPPGDFYILRTLKFARYLPEFGWRPIVLTPLQSSPKRANFLESIPPNTRVIRTGRMLTPSATLRRRFHSRVAATDNSAATTAPSSANDAATIGARARLGRVLRQLLRWGDMPDEYAGWLPQALAHGRRLIHTHRVEAIHATGPPFSTVVAGALLSRLTGVPLVADFRDAWVQDADDPIGVLSGSYSAAPDPLRLAALAALERFCLQSAARVLFTSSYTRDRYQQVYPDLAAKSVLIWNGISEEDFDAPPRQFDNFTFFYGGTLHDFQLQQVGCFLRAFAAARARNAAFADARVVLMGARGVALEQRLSAIINELGLAQYVERRDFGPRAQAVSSMRGAGALLLFAANNRFTRLTKISDYAATGRPILALALSDSETARQVRALGHQIYAGDDADELAALLIALFERGGPQTPEETAFSFFYPHPLHWKTGTQQLAAQLDALVG